MKTQSIDTSPEFEQVQIARIRAFSAAKKFKSICSWTQSITSANLHASHSSSQNISERDQAIAFIAREYGNHTAYLFRNEIDKQPTWELDNPDIQEILLSIMSIVQRFNIPALLIGSVASSVYGFPRSAQDIDILADLHKEQIPILFKELMPTYVFDPSTVTSSDQQQPFSLLHISRLIKIDVHFPSTLFETAILARRQPHELIEGKAPLFMASAEDITLLNLIQYQARGSNADDRWNDILGILKIQAPTLDLSYLHQQAQALDVEELLSQALVDAGIYNKKLS